MTDQKRTVEGILHFLTPQQMAEEIVRLDAVIAGRRPNIAMGRVPRPPKCQRCGGERTIDQTGYGEYRPCPDCNPESPYYEPPTSGVMASQAPSWQAEAMARAAYERGCNAMRDRAIGLIEARHESGHTCEPWVLVKELRALGNPTDPAGVKVPAPAGHIMSPPSDEEAVAEDRRAVLQLLYEAHHREPCGPTLEAISAAIQHLQAVDAAGVEGPEHG